MFAFVLWDRRSGRLLAARDRFGKKPLCYAHGPHGFAAASEIPALLALGASERRISLPNLAFFWHLGYIPAPHSGFTDIHKLPAGHALSWQRGRLNVWRYYPPREVRPFRGSYPEAIETFQALLEDAVRRRLVSDVPLGVALSGGLDSACVTAAARGLSSRALVTLTVRPGSPSPEYDEGEWAQATAGALRTDHAEVRPDSKLSESFETIVRHMGEPFAIGSSAPCFYLFQAMKPHATVVLSGDGGDELFAGYPVYRFVRIAQRLRVLFPPALCRLLYGLLDATYGPARPARPALRGTMLSLQFLMGRPPTDAMWEHRQVLQPGAYRELMPVERIREHQGELASMFAERDPTRLQMVTDQFDNMTYQILSKVDITSMAHAVEVRSPLLDHRIAEFARSLPMAYLAQNGRGKRIVRDSLAGKVPERVLDKRKSGFGLPVREWLAGDGRAWVLDLLTPPAPTFDEVVRRDRIAALVERHRRGRPDVTSLLLRLVALRLWVDQTGARL
jgi:asparagine synthase (glutamine-hydrolysing)